MYNTWHDITLSQYSQIYNILTDETLSEEDKIVLITTELFNVDILNTEFSLVANKLKIVTNLLGQEIPTGIVPEQYVINDTEYVLTKDLSKITTAQYFDYMNYMNGEIKNVNNYHEFLSIFLIPKGKTYNNGYDIIKVKKDILSLSIVDALGIADFFLTSYKNLLKIFRKYLVWEALTMKGVTMKEKKEIIKKIVGDFSL